MKHGFFRAIAVFCQLLTLFPFVVVIEGISFSEYVPWHYVLIYAVLGGFYAFGRLMSAWYSGSEHSIVKKGWALFISRAAVLLPGAAFCIAVASIGLSTGFYIYILPACVLSYWGGYKTHGVSYSDTFTVGWFAIYFAAALAGIGLLWFTHDEKLYHDGTFQFCVVFGILTVLAAVLANQTNIDVRTAQRSGGRSVLPNGLRSYNMLIIAAVSAVTVALFLFAKPLAELFGAGIAAVLKLLIALLNRENHQPEPDDPAMEDETGELIGITESDSALFEISRLAVIVGLIILAVRFRKQIWETIKEFFAPLFKESQKSEALPFVDEVTDFAVKQDSPRSARKREQLLQKQYKSETDPQKKFRTGYALFLLRLSQTPFAQKLSDTTTIHTRKGQSAFRREDIADMVQVYNSVRYGEKSPAAEQLIKQEKLLDELCRKG